MFALLGELAEFLASVWGTKKFGGTNWGAGGALLGTLVGGLVGTFAIPVPVLGSLIGACAGAALGAWGFELWAGQKMKLSLKSAAGAGIGRLSGTVAKLAAGVLIWVVAAVAAFGREDANQNPARKGAGKLVRHIPQPTEQTVPCPCVRGSDCASALAGGVLIGAVAVP